MLPLRRLRYPRKELLARYWCAACQQHEHWHCFLAPRSRLDPYPSVWWRPKKALCRICGVEMVYEGFVSGDGGR